MQKAWFCMHLYPGNVVLIGVFVFPDPDPDLSGGGGGRGPVRLRSPAPGPALGPNSSRPATGRAGSAAIFAPQAGGSGAIPCRTAPSGEELVAVLPPFTSASTPPHDPGRPMSKSKAIPLHSVSGRIRKPAPVALAALTGETSDDCERALRKHQDGRSVRGTPSTAIVPAGHDLGLLLEPVFQEGTGRRLGPLVATRRFAHPMLLELGGGCSQKPHYLALTFMPGPSGFDTLHIADVLNPSPVPFTERIGNPGGCGDGRKVRNAWRVLKPHKIERFRSDIVRVDAEPDGIAFYEAPPLYTHSIDILAPQLKAALAGETVPVTGCGPTIVDLVSHPGEEKPGDFTGLGFVWRAEKVRCGLIAHAAREKDKNRRARDRKPGMPKERPPHVMVVGTGSQATALWRRFVSSSAKVPPGPWYAIRENPDAWLPEWFVDFLQCLALYWLMHEAPERARPKHSTRALLETDCRLGDWYTSPRLLRFVALKDDSHRSH